MVSLVSAHVMKKGMDWLLFGIIFLRWSSPVILVVKNAPAMQEMEERQIWSLGGEAPPEEGMATHSSILAWEIPWTEESGRLQSTGCKESDTTEATEHIFLRMIV